MDADAGIQFVQGIVQLFFRVFMLAMVWQTIWFFGGLNYIKKHFK